MKVAIVGSGVSGLSAAWMLNEHSDHEVTLYEKNGTIGGHTNTIDYHKTPQGPLNECGQPAYEDEKVPVDTGFIVLNTLNYPNFVNFLAEVGVETIPSSMTFSVSKGGGSFEWAGTNVYTLFCQAANIFRPSFYRMIYDIIKFNMLAPKFLELDPLTDPRAGWTLDQYLEENNYSKAFIEDYLIPMSAAIWSTPPDTCLKEFPALTAIQFMANHCLLQVEGRPQWRTVKDGSRSYVHRILSKLGDVRTSCPVVDISTVTPCPETGNRRVKVIDQLGGVDYFDHVIIASHADEALSMLGENATSDEKEILGKFKFSTNYAVVHSDISLMPLRKGAWSSWNYLDYHTDSESIGGTEEPSPPGVSLTYWMNLLQSIDSNKYGDIFVTLNPSLPPRKESVFAEFEYMHPVFTTESVAAQARLESIQGLPDRPISFAGAWQGYGFHEDGFRAGAREACRLGATPPFELVSPPEFNLSKDQKLQEIKYDAFAFIDQLLLAFIFPFLAFLLGEEK